MYTKVRKSINVIRRGQWVNFKTPDSANEIGLFQIESLQETNGFFSCSLCDATGTTKHENVKVTNLKKA